MHGLETVFIELILRIFSTCRRYNTDSIIIANFIQDTYKENHS